MLNVTHNVNYGQGETFGDAFIANYLEHFGNPPVYSGSYSLPGLTVEAVVAILSAMKITHKLAGEIDTDELFEHISALRDVQMMYNSSSSVRRAHRRGSGRRPAGDPYAIFHSFQIKSPVGMIRIYTNSAKIYDEAPPVTSDEVDAVTTTIQFMTDQRATYKAVAAVEQRKLEVVPTDANLGVIIADARGQLDIFHSSVTPQVLLAGTRVAQEQEELAECIAEGIKDKSQGLILLHGDPGTGKTSFIRSLVHRFQDREFVVMPPELFERASDPSFLRFMMLECRDAILIIEDAERLLTKRAEGDSSLGISTLLNMGDGLLADVLTAPIICTFNMSVGTIDPAAIRKGRLIKRHEFGPLCANDVRLIITDAGVDYTGHINDNTLTIADVYEGIRTWKGGDQAEATASFSRATKTFGFGK